MKLTEKDLIDLLLAKHSQDVAVPHCKTGPSYGNRELGIIDVWVMNKSWVHPKVTAYEIKVNRQDFLKDEKWRGYLPFCNEMVFVTPPKIATADEMPPEVGLITTSVNGTRLYTRKKAQYREVEIPEMIWRYILMNRAQISRHDSRERWRDWLKQKDEDKTLGLEVERAMGRAVKDRVDKQEDECRKMRREIKQIKSVQERLEYAGLWPPGNYVQGRDKVGQFIERAQTGLPVKFLESLQGARRALDSLIDVVKEEQQD